MQGTFIYLAMTMQYMSVVVRLKCHCNLCTQRRWVYFVHLHVPLKTQLAAKDSQTINRQSSMWAEITLDNDDNKRIEENKDRGERVRGDGRRQKRQDGGTRCLNINSLESKSPSLRFDFLMSLLHKYTLPPSVLKDGGAFF